MPTTRRRTNRRQGSALSPEIRALFSVGCGWNAIGDEEVKRLWDEHGDSFLRTHQSSEPCFAEMALGSPEDE